MKTLKYFTEKEHEIYRQISYAHAAEDFKSKYHCGDEQSLELGEELMDNLPDPYFEAYWEALDQIAEEYNLIEKEEEDI